MIVTVKRTFRARCPVDVGGYSYENRHRWETPEFDSPDKAMCALFDHLSEKHKVGQNGLVYSRDTDQ